MLPETESKDRTCEHCRQPFTRQREYYRQNREKIEERKRKWALENPDLVHAQRVRSNMRKKMKKLGWAISRYDLTAEKYLSMLASQNGGCAICGRTYGNARRRRLAVDHCHSTGVIRGLLCSRCNSVLGYMLDDPQLLRRAADYLESAGGACQTTGASPNGNSFSV